MKRIVVALACLCAAVPAAGAAPITHGPVRARAINSTSTNWSGYAATANKFTSVSAAWTQPSVTCASGETSYSSFWVGIDGDGSNTVEQTGTDADCSSGQPRYYAWYEMYPKFPTNLSMAVHPGDAMSASVTVSKRGAFTLTITNVSTGATYTTQQTLKRASLYSAEVIAEAPSSSGGVLPLANFGTVSFTASSANGSALGAFSPDAITMVTSNGTVKAQPGALNGGTDFSVTWHHS